MAYPAGITTKQVTGTFADLYLDSNDGIIKSRPKKGYVLVYPSPDSIKINATNVIYDLTDLKPQRVAIDINGTFTFEAIVTDQAGITPNNGWSYRIEPQWGEQSANIPIKASDPATININTYFGRAEVPGVIEVQGPAGKGINSITSAGNLATVNYSDGSTGTFELPIGDGTGSSTPNATNAVYGKVLIAGDLAGNAGAIVIGADKIDSSKLSPAVRTSLAKADTAIQSASLTKAAVGLANVDNTSDVNKPVSNATQSALNLKVNISSLHAVATSGSYVDLVNKPTIPSTKGDIGLGNVDNTSDVNKPISSAVTSALAGKANATHTHIEYVKSVNGATPDGTGNTTVTIGWTAITGKPTAFTPEAHTHLWADLTDKPTTFAPIAHSHAQTDITGLAATLSGKSDTTHVHTYSSLTGVPTTFTPSAHTHTAANISDSTTVGRSILMAADAAAVRTATGAGTSNLALGSTASTAAAGNHVHAYSALTGIPATFTPAAHTHVVSDTTGLQAALDGKAATSHTHTTAQITNLDTLLAGKANASALTTKADLVGGFVPTSQIAPRSLISSIAVADQAAMLALTSAQVQEGDVAVIASQQTSFMLGAGNPNDLNSWTKLSWAPGTGGSTTVQTVNGQVGDIILGKADIGLANVDNTTDLNKPISTAVSTALSGKAASSHTHTAANISDSTVVGRAVLSATDATTARTAIGAGTGNSNLAIGTTGSTAKAGNYVPAWSEITSKPTTFTPEIHNHAIADVTGLQTALDNAPTTFEGAIAKTPLYMSPESANAVTIPYMMNDIAFNELRGGSTKVLINGVETSTYDNAKNLLFTPDSNAISIPVSGLTSVVFEVTLCRSFKYGTKVGFAVNESWRGRDVTIEAYDNTSWTTVYTGVNIASGEVVKQVSFTESVYKLRYTFSNFVSGASFRMGQLFALAYNSGLASGPFMSREGGELYGAITSTVSPTNPMHLTRKDYVDNTIGVVSADVTALTGVVSGKENVIAAGTTAQYLRGDKTWQSLTNSAVAGSAPLVSPAFTGSPTAPTQSGADNSTKLATTAFVVTAVSGKANTSHTHLWADITDKPATFTPATHSHAQSDITGLTAALGGKEDTLTAGTAAQYYRGDKTWQTLNSTAIGLGNVTNTSDATKFSNTPLTGIPTAPTAAPGVNTTQIATTAYVVAGLGGKANASHTHAQSDVTNLTTDLAAKAPLANPAFTGTVTGVTKGMVGLGSVDNTSDASKPVSTATQTALDGKANSSHTHNVSDINATGTANSTTYLRGDGSWAVVAAGASDWNSLTGKPTTFDPTIGTTATTAKAGNYVPTWSEITSKPSTFAPSAHSHVTADVTGLDAALTGKAPIASPTFTGTVSGITKSMVGLANADNTADSAKPVSTAQQTALNLKANLASPTFTGTVGGITKAMVGLGSVDNTTDAAKPISTSTQTALDGKAATSHTHAYSSLTSIPSTFAPSAHTHNIADINATGTKDATTYLRGDGTWAAAGGGGTDKVNNAAGQNLTLWKGTSAEYAAIATKDANTIYVVA